VGAASLVVSGAVAVGTVKTTTDTTVAPSPTQVALPPGGDSPPAPGTIGPGSSRPAAVSTANPAASSTTTVASTGSSTTVAGEGTSTTLAGSLATSPSTPTNVMAIAGNGEVTVSWSTPSDGGSPITSYVVTSYVDGATQALDTSTSSVTSYLDTGLTNGTTYTFTVAATNAVGVGSPSAPTSKVTPTAPALNIVNGGSLAGRAQKGDQIIVTFSPAPVPSSFCAAWSATSFPDLDDSNVEVHGIPSSSGDDTVTVTDSVDCNGGFHFGTIDLGQAGYFDSDVTFGGNVTGCRNGKTTGCSTIHWDGQNTLTITLGTVSGTQSTQSAPSVAVYDPAPSLGLSAPIYSVDHVNF